MANRPEGCRGEACGAAGVQRRRGGFTLVELLVVIAILGLLMSILLPSLSAAKEMARRGVCLANVRRLAVAGQMYVHDNGVFPPVRMSYNRDGSVYVNAYGRSRPRWQWFLDEGIGPVIDPAPYNGAAFGDAETTEMTNDYFVCPSLGGEFQRDIRNGAYGYNYQYLGDSRAVTGGQYTNYPVSESSIRAPAATVFVGDSRGGDPRHGRHSYTLDPPKLAASRGVTKFGPTAGSDGPIGHSPVEQRHRDTGNVSFVDGHAESLTSEQLGYVLDSAGVVVPGQGNNRLWTGKGQDEP